MLEKQKEWCQNKVEKGKAWIEDHKLLDVLLEQHQRFFCMLSEKRLWSLRIS